MRTRVMALGASILALAGMTAWLAPSASAASPAASAKATLKIVVSDLPAKATAAVKVTGPDGYSRKVTATISLTGLAAGSYDVTATAVTVSGTNYVPALTGASQDLKAGGSATSTVAYYTQIPATTKPVSASDITSVTTSSSGTMTIVVHGASPLAKGDVLAVGTGKATPDGLLAKITKTSANGSAQTLTATAATLKEAIPQGEFDYSEALGSEAAGTSSSGVLSGSLRASSAGGFSDNFECGSDASLDVKGTATADVSATLDAHWSSSQTVVDAAATAQESSTITATLSAAADCTLSPTAISSLFTLKPFVVPVGEVPVVVVPKVQFFVQGSASDSAEVTASVSQTMTAKAGLTYDNGTLTPASSLSRTSKWTEPDLSGTADLNISAGPDVTLDLYGLAGPVINVDAGLDLQANTTADPWWYLDATVNAGVSVHWPLLGIVASAPNIISLKFRLAEAAGRYGSGTATEIVANGLGDNPENGTTPLVSGPGDSLWMVGDCSSACVQSIDPTTDAVTTRTLDSSDYLDGPLAFDGDGNLWLSATDQSTSTDYLLRYDPSTGKVTTFAVPSDCQGSLSGGYGQLSSASDGAVWMLCFNMNLGYEWFVRIVDSGAMQIVQLQYGATAPVAGADGTMWAASTCTLGCATGVIEFTPDMTQTFYGDPSGVTMEAVAGNGTGSLMEIADCKTSTGTYTCYESIGADGMRTLLSTAPEVYNPAATLYREGMDSDGDVWELIDETATTAAPAGQFYVEVTPSGTRTLDPLDLPSPNSDQQLIPTGPFVITSDGAVWCEQATPDQGYLIRYAPD